MRDCFQFLTFFDVLTFLVSPSFQFHYAFLATIRKLKGLNLRGMTLPVVGEFFRQSILCARSQFARLSRLLERRYKSVISCTLTMKHLPAKAKPGIRGQAQAGPHLQFDTEIKWKCRCPGNLRPFLFRTKLRPFPANSKTNSTSLFRIRNQNDSAVEWIREMLSTFPWERPVLFGPQSTAHSWTRLCLRVERGEGWAVWLVGWLVASRESEE